MRKGLLALVVCVLAVVVVFISRPRVVGVFPEDLLARSPEAEEVFAPTHYHDDFFDKSDDFFVEQWLTKIDPASLERLASGDDDATNGYAFSMRSSWLPGLSGLPTASVRIRCNAETETYELQGGDFEFKAGWGIGYEEDAVSGDGRSYFQYKKSF